MNQPWIHRVSLILFFLKASQTNSRPVEKVGYFVAKELKQKNAFCLLFLQICPFQHLIDLMSCDLVMAVAHPLE